MGIHKIRRVRWRRHLDQTQLSVGDAFRWLLRSSFWKRHPMPFNKTPRGKARRDQRKFKLREREDAMLYTA